MSVNLHALAYHPYVVAAWSVGLGGWALLVMQTMRSWRQTVRTLEGGNR